MFTHFLSAIAIALLYKRPVIQTAIIFTLALVLFLWTVIIRPFASTFHLILEILTQLILTIALACLLAAAVYAQKGCFECRGREGFLCYFILGLLAAYLMLLGLGLLIFGLLGRCCGSKAYGEGKTHLSQTHNLSMEIPDHPDSAGINQNQFQVNTLFDQKEGLQSQHHVNQNITYGNSNQQTSNMFNTNHLISQADVNQNKTHNQHMTNQEHVISEESLGNISISPPSSINQMAMNTSNSEYSSRIRRHERHQDTYHRPVVMRKNMQNTRTMQIDSDDESLKQRQVIAALSNSQISYSDVDMGDFDSVRRSVDYNKREYLRDKYELEETMQRHRTTGGKTTYYKSTQNKQYSPKSDQISDGWRFSKKNYYETSQDEMNRF
jgi:hypothetical protein